MKLFMTGATGFLGGRVARLAVQRGHEVAALIRQIPGRAPRTFQGPEWIEGALAALAPSTFAGYDAVLHFAAHGVSPQRTTWREAHDVNVTQSLCMLEAALDAGVKNILLCGSGNEFGRSGNEYEQLPPDAPLKPLGAYSASKAAFSVSSEALAAGRGSAVSLVRAFSLYGAGQHADNFWPSLRHAALEGADFPMTSGEQVRDFLPVEKGAEMILRWMEEERLPGFYKTNIGSGNPVRLLDFAQACWSEWGAKGKLLPGALPYSRAEIMRLIPQIGSCVIS